MVFLIVYICVSPFVQRTQGYFLAALRSLFFQLHACEQTQKAFVLRTSLGFLAVHSWRPNPKHWEISPTDFAL